MTLKNGAKLGRYEIRSLIGAGGMGEVYRATDPKIGRDVAIKVLPADFSADKERVARFEQEAQAAGALNHPNIIAIYDVDTHDDILYVVSELLVGEELRQRLDEGPIPLRKVIDYAQQIVSGLAAAHEKGVAHRDLKPENLFITKDDRVKILDFGLAKLRPPNPQAGSSEDETRKAITNPGVVMGTVGYMSPEQVRGHATDYRSDIFSFGVILHELITGRRAFKRETTAETMSAILKEEPAELSESNPNVSPSLERIVRRCLEKKPERRFQSTSDLGFALESLSAPTSSSGAGALAEGERRIYTSGAFISEKMRRHTVGAAILIGIAVVILAGFGYGVYRFLYSKPFEKPPANPSNVQTQRLTGDGRTRDPEISPDGKFLAYVKMGGGKESLWIKQVQTNSNINVVKPGEFDPFLGITFSPDGNFIYFNAGNSSSDSPTVYRVPTLGGTPVKVLSNAQRVQFSPDGKQISFRRLDAAKTADSVFIANADGSNERELAVRTGKQFFAAAAVWSPDGKSVAVGAGDDALAPAPNFFVALISIADGGFSEFGSRRWEGVDDLVWHPSGDSLIVSTSENSFQQGQLWELSYPSGEYRRLTNDLNGHNGVSITADGKSIVTGELYSRSSVWVSPDLKPENAKQVMPSTGDTQGFAWTPDGRIVYASDQTGDVEIWIMNADGSGARPLTSDRIFKLDPTVSPDGRHIVYTTSQNGGQLVRIDIGGGNPLMLTKNNNSVDAHISPDGKWVTHLAFIDGHDRVLRVAIDGGDAQLLTDYAAKAPRYSNDGKWFACFLLNEKSLAWDRLAIVPADGGQPIKVFNVPPDTNNERGPVWTPDDRGITLVVASGEQQNLWLQPVDGGEAKPMTNFEIPGVARRDYSRDGKRIAIVRAEDISNAIMITGFR